MSAIRLILMRILFIIIISLISGKGYGQWRLADSSAEWNSILDTSDYFPYTYTDALDLNLLIAASGGYSSEIIRLIKKGADVNAKTVEGATPLIFAVINNKPLAVITLLAYKPDINVVTNNDETALLIAVKSRYFEVTETLIRAGADLSHADRYGATALHHAAINGFTDIVDLLVYYDADLNQKTAIGTTPLLASIWAGYTDVSDLLIQNGANTEEIDNDGFTPFLMASFYGDTITMDILRKHGANIYATNNTHHNALSLAISAGNTAVAEYLLKIGDKWKDQGNAAVNLYSVAAKYRRTEMINILKDNNIPGKLKREIDQISLSPSTRISSHDLYGGMSLSFKEPYSNGGFILGCDTKLWYSRVLIRESENSFIQYKDRGAVAYAGVFKDFALTDHPVGFNYLISTSLSAGYPFGNRLKGTYIYPENKLKIMPAAAFKITRMNLSYYAGIEYVKTSFYKNGPVWIRIGFSYNYFFDNIRTKIKPIRWY